MTEANSQARSGLFVFLGILLFLTSIIFLGGDRAFLKNYVPYKVKLKSSQGLAEGSVVSISGVPAGNVQSIHFGESTEIVIEINIEKKMSHLITDQALASVRTQGALGDKYIYIHPGPSTGRVLQPNEFILADSQPDLIDMISGKASDLSVFLDVMRELNQLLQNLNANGKSALLMENIVEASQNISKLVNEPSVRGSFSHLRSILRKVDDGNGTLGQLVNDSALHERLMGILGDTPRNKYLKPLLREAIRQNENQREIKPE